MFTGIIETLGTIQKIKQEGTNVHFTIQSLISKELKIDQSLAHNGVCLTVVDVYDEAHTVTAIDETLKRTNFQYLKTGDTLNLERAMLATARLDGHIVQGHVDTTAICTSREDQNGSWLFGFRYNPTPQYILVEKGSVCINGVSLTVVQATLDAFSVAIIPYTMAHTTFGQLQVNDTVNLEFDILGKYIARYFEVYKNVLV